MEIISNSAVSLSTNSHVDNVWRCNFASRAVRGRGPLRPAKPPNRAATSLPLWKWLHSYGIQAQ